MARTTGDDFNKVSIANISLRTLQCSFTLSVRNLYRKLSPVLETEPKIPVPTRMNLSLKTSVDSGFIWDVRVDPHLEVLSYKDFEEAAGF
ncbi:hypothetical protein WN943_027407 [Citrus x changshan-huyou]